MINNLLILKNDFMNTETVLEQLAKKVENLRRRNKKFQMIIKELKKFKKIMGQSMHDMQAPLSSLHVISDSSNELSKQKRITLRSAVISATDIANCALQNYKPTKNGKTENNQRQVVLVSTILSEIVNDRTFRYKGRSIKISFDLTPLNAFLFIKVSPSDLKRAISNLINNAVDSFPETGGEISLKLKASDEWVYISVLDDGCGMPEEIIKKIKNGISVTAGKEEGHGIGLTQVHDMLTNNFGEIGVYSSTSSMNHGTTIELIFPKLATPNWIATDISLAKDDTVIILDNDIEMHDVWSTKFQHILEKIPSITVKHFASTAETKAFLEKLSESEKQKVCFFSEYELSTQNGLQVIEELKIKRSILVTNHFPSIELRKSVTQNRIKILPKELISAFSVKIIQKKKKSIDELVHVHMVFVDDEKFVTKAIVTEYYNHLIIDSYSNPFEFLDEVDKYPKDTKFILDNYYYDENSKSYDIDGIGIAEKLHAKGFTRLFLLSGESFSVPDYLTLILKSDKEKIRNLDKL